MFSISDILRSLRTAVDTNLKGFVTNIEKDTAENSDFRRVLYTGKTSQLVLMALKAKEDIGEEVHEAVDQFFRIDQGGGTVVINDTEHPVKNGSAFVVPAGAKHNVIAGDKGMKLYSIYSPPNHKDGTIHHTKQDATEEHFDGKTTELGTRTAADKTLKQNVIQFLKSHPNPNDKAFHAWAESLGVEHSLAEQAAYELATSYVKNLKD